METSPPRVRRNSGARPSPPRTPRAARRNSRTVSIFIVLACTLVGCIFFPLLVTLSFIIILNRKVREALIGQSSGTIVFLQMLACVPFYFAGPILLTVCAGVQILFSAYHSAASEFLLISFCLPFLFTSPWWGSWWYVAYVPLSCAVPISYMAWEQARSKLIPLWKKWAYEKGARAAIVTNVNAGRYHFNKVLDRTGRSFPFVRYLRKFLKETFAN
jgi:hypothetical protein